MSTPLVDDRSSFIVSLPALVNVPVTLVSEPVSIVTKPLPPVLSAVTL